MNIARKITVFLVYFITGGVIYFTFEICVRGYSHISMLLCGGMAFFVVGYIGNRIIESDMNLGISLLMIMVVGTLIITGIEFITGVYVNIYLGLAVWNYGGMRYNFMGQVCLLYSALWGVMSLPCVYYYGIINKFVLDGKKKQKNSQA